MTKHFDYFRFYDMLLVIYCDEKDEILGHFTLRNGNEFGQLYVSPQHRGTEIVHILVKEARAIVQNLNFSYIHGVCYERMKRFYELFARRTKVKIEFPETPEERPDGQYRVVFRFNETSSDRGANVR